MPIFTPVRDTHDLHNILTVYGMEKYCEAPQSLGWITFESFDDAMEMIYNAMDNGAYDTLSGYLYHYNRTFELDDFREVAFYWSHGIIELECEKIHMKVKKCQEIRFLIQDETYNLIVYFDFGRGSSCVFKLSAE